MLKSLDILIGLSVVMLIVSMAVTLINQAILNAIAARGRCLRNGLADLLQHLDWKMPRKSAEEVAAMVLTQPSVRRTKIGPMLGELFPSLQFGEVIHREELAKILLGFDSRATDIKKGLDALRAAVSANRNGAAQDQVVAEAATLCCAVQGVTGIQSQLLKAIENALVEIGQTTNQERQTAAVNRVAESLAVILDPLERAVAAIKANGIAEPGKTLENVRMMALQLEKSNPEQANDVRQSNALLQEASSPFLAKINLVFDQTMDRVTARYTGNARIVTMISAGIVAVVLQLDTIDIVNRLAMDDNMRKVFVEQAVKLDRDPDVRKKLEAGAAAKEASAAPAAGAPAAGASIDPAKNLQPAQEAKPSQAGVSDDASYEEKRKEYMGFLAQQGVVQIPQSFPKWLSEWNFYKIPGVLLSILLLSMGAPFWYRAISKLLQFRSLLAQKDDEQRVTRQTTQAAETAPKPGAPAAQSSQAMGERGDLNAVI